MTLISAVIPVFNEEEVIPALLDRLQPLLVNPEFSLELVFVDDGSHDRSVAILREKIVKFPSWKLILLARNFGQQAAFRAGLEQARGDAVIFLDADLQDPPELIPALLEKWRQGNKVVVARRKSRQEGFFRRFLTSQFHRIFHWSTGGAMPEESGTFGLMDRSVAEVLKQMPERNLFLPALRCWPVNSIATVEYDRDSRAAGQPKQTFAKLLSYAWDGITSFSDFPLKLIFGVGLVVSAAGFLYAAFLIAVKLAQIFGYLSFLSVEGFTTVAVAIFCLGGIQMISLGVIGEYLSRVYREVKHRPHYVVASVEDSSP